MDQCLQRHHTAAQDQRRDHQSPVVTAAGRGDVARHGGRNDLGHAVAQSHPRHGLGRVGRKAAPDQGEREADDAHKGGPKQHGAAHVEQSVVGGDGHEDGNHLQAKSHHQRADLPHCIRHAVPQEARRRCRQPHNHPHPPALVGQQRQLDQDGHRVRGAHGKAKACAKVGGDEQPHPAPGRCGGCGCSLSGCRLHGHGRRHPKPCGPKKGDAEQPEAQPLAVPRQALHQGRHRHARDGDAQAEPHKVQPQLRPVPLPNQPVEYQPRRQQQPRRAGKPRHKPQHGPDGHAVCPAHRRRADHGNHQAASVDQVLAPQVVDRGCEQGARHVAGIVDGGQPPRRPVREARLLAHDGQHGRVGKARQPHREDERTNARHDDTPACGLLDRKRGVHAGSTVQEQRW